MTGNVINLKLANATIQCEIEIKVERIVLRRQHLKHRNQPH